MENMSRTRKNLEVTQLIEDNKKSMLKSNGEENQPVETLPKDLKHLKSYFKKALIEEIDLRRKNMKIMNSKPILKLLSNKTSLKVK